MPNPVIFQGGIFADSLEGGRAGASIVATHKAVEAQATDGTLFAIPLSELQLEIGGASGKMVFCRNTDRSLTLFTEDAGFLDSLHAAGGHHVQSLVDTLRQDTREKRKRSTLLGVAIVTLVIGLGTCTVQSLGTIAHTSANSIPWSVDTYIGETAIESMDLGGSKVTDEAVVAVPQAIVEKLGRELAIEELKLEIHVVDNKQVNAFALPGGQMVVFTGLLEKASRPEEVAGVLAHEISHVTERHGLERIIQSLGIISLVQVVMGDATGVMGAAAQLLTVAAINDYSRDQESEADSAGVLLLYDAGIDPSGLPGFFSVLKEEDSDTPEAMQEVLSWMSTHPDTDERIAKTNAQVKALPQATYEPINVGWDAMKRALDTPKEP